ncbi:MAG: hypothetical protein P1U87_03230 [Verrucomicrobiales bacterium]|nr:hypothetical protein [Verrucomicrobiales bacterium]
MIRIPFSAATESQEDRPGFPSPSVNPQSSKSVEEIDARISILEKKLTAHAEELKSNITDRVDRIESRFQRALVSLGSESESGSEEKVVEFKSDQVTLHHLPATAALHALKELNETLLLARDHVDALGESVERMRRASGQRN